MGDITADRKREQLRSRVHDVARRGFSAAPERYDRGRPGYPDAAVSWMVDRLGIGPGVRVVDLAAGTGKLTRQLAPFDPEMIAIEPIAAMAGVLSEHLPQVPVVRAVAEEMPLSDNSVDVVAVAQAFHWFDPDSTWPELARVIRHGGGVALIWNVRDRSVPWVDRMWQVMDRVEKRAPWREHDTDPLRGLEPRPGFAGLEKATFFHDVESTLAEIQDRFASVSHVAVLDEKDRRSVLNEVSSIALAQTDAWRDDKIVIRYRTDAYLTFRS